MIIFKRTFTRPNLDVFWYNDLIQPDVDWLERWTYYTTEEKIINWTTTTSDDGFTLEYVAHWVDIQSFHEYDHDPMMQNYWNLRDAYLAENNIIMGNKILQYYKNDVLIEKILPTTWNISDI